MTMRPSLHSWRLASTAALLALAGCFKLARETPPVQFFVLGGAASPTGVAASPGAAPTPDSAFFALGLRRLSVASYLTAPVIVVRRGVNALLFSDFHRWGEDLGEGINRVVAAHLTQSRQVRSVDVAPWPTRTRHDLVVQLTVSRFEGVADSGTTEGRSHLVATWDIVRPLDGRLLIRGNTDTFAGRWRIGDYAGLVAGLDATLVRVARDISVCLSRFANDSTPPPRCAPSAQAER